MVFLRDTDTTHSEPPCPSAVTVIQFPPMQGSQQSLGTDRQSGPRLCSASKVPALQTCFSLLLLPDTLFQATSVRRPRRLTNRSLLQAMGQQIAMIKQRAVTSLHGLDLRMAIVGSPQTPKPPLKEHSRALRCIGPLICLKSQHPTVAQDLKIFGLL